MQIFLKICDALAFAHSKGVVHRDLKPDNVMVGRHGQVYLMDWGVALLSARRLRSSPASHGRVTLSDDLARDTRDDGGAIVGTFEYMAPEQAWGRTRELDARTDVFGLGGILYQLLTGRGPNAAENAFESLQRAQRGRVDPPELHGAWPSIPPGLCRIAMKALSKIRDDRYATATAMRDDVEDFLAAAAGSIRGPSRQAPSSSSKGDPADAAYIIVRRHLRGQQDIGGVRAVLRRLGPGDVFGETAVLTGEPRTATVVALDDVMVKVVTRDALEREFDRTSWSGRVREGSRGSVSRRRRAAREASWRGLITASLATASCRAVLARRGLRAPCRDAISRLRRRRHRIRLWTRRCGLGVRRFCFDGLGGRPGLALAAGAGAGGADGDDTGVGGASFAAGAGGPPGSFCSASVLSCICGMSTTSRFVS